MKRYLIEPETVSTPPPYHRLAPRSSNAENIGVCSRLSDRRHSRRRYPFSSELTSRPSCARSSALIDLRTGVSMDAARSTNQNPSNRTALSLRVGGGLTLSTSAEPCAACSRVLCATASIPDVADDEEGIIVVDTHCDACGAHQHHRYRVRSMSGLWSAIDIEVDGAWQTQVLVNCDLWHQINRDTASSVNSPTRQGGCI